MKKTLLILAVLASSAHAQPSNQCVTHLMWSGQPRDMANHLCHGIPLPPDYYPYTWRVNPDGTTTTLRGKEMEEHEANRWKREQEPARQTELKGLLSNRTTFDN